MTEEMRKFEMPDETWSMLYGKSINPKWACLIMRKWTSWVIGFEVMGKGLAIFVGPLCFAIGRTRPTP